MSAHTSAAPRLAAPDPHVEAARAAAAGDRAAASALLRAVAPHMKRVIGLVLRSRSAAADDVLQAAMLGFVRALPAFRGECRLTSYATRIAAREAMAARRRSRAKAHAELGETAQPMPNHRNPETISAREKRQTLMLELLDTLPAEQAETLGLRVVLGLSLEEVAEATGAPLNTVRSRVRLAKEALRERILANTRYAEALGEQQ